MTTRKLKIGLAVSIALNLFAVAAGVTALVAHERIEDRIESQRRPARGQSIMAVVDSMDPAVRDRVRRDLRAVAMASRPDFDAARTARRAAQTAAGAGPFDAAEVRDLLETSRTAELRGRARLEDGAVTVLESLEADDRKALAPILSRRGRHGGGSGPEGRRQAATAK